MKIYFNTRNLCDKKKIEVYTEHGLVGDAILEKSNNLCYIDMPELNDKKYRQLGFVFGKKAELQKPYRFMVEEDTEKLCFDIFPEAVRIAMEKETVEYKCSWEQADGYDEEEKLQSEGDSEQEAGNGNIFAWPNEIYKTTIECEFEDIETLYIDFDNINLLDSVYSKVVSIKKNGEVRTESFEEKQTLECIYTEDEIKRAYKDSIMVSLLMTGMLMILAIPAAWLFARWFIGEDWLILKIAAIVLEAGSVLLCREMIKDIKKAKNLLLKNRIISIDEIEGVYGANETKTVKDFVTLPGGECERLPHAIYIRNAYIPAYEIFIYADDEIVYSGIEKYDVGAKLDIGNFSGKTLRFRWHEVSAVGERIGFKRPFMGILPTTKLFERIVKSPLKGCYDTVIENISPEVKNISLYFRGSKIAENFPVLDVDSKSQDEKLNIRFERNERYAELLRKTRRNGIILLVIKAVIFFAVVFAAQYIEKMLNLSWNLTDLAANTVFVLELLSIGLHIRSVKSNEAAIEAIKSYRETEKRIIKLS